jgi:hypothetical protein
MSENLREFERLLGLQHFGFGLSCPAKFKRSGSKQQYRLIL